MSDRDKIEELRTNLKQTPGCVNPLTDYWRGVSDGAMSALNVLNRLFPEPLPAPVPEPPPFKVGEYVIHCTNDFRDWATENGPTGAVRVIRLEDVKHPSGELWPVFAFSDTRWNPCQFRKATPEEVRAVTHFTPKVGMIVRNNEHGHVWISVGDGWARRIDDRSVAIATIGNELAHADWTILDSFTVTGVKA
jgi:hypothetical protein